MLQLHMPRTAVLVRICIITACVAGMTVSAHGAVTVDDEPTCTIFEDSGEVFNFIGRGLGANWWGPKSLQSTPPVSWIDRCAKQLEACQDAEVDPSVPSEICVCQMWQCLHPPVGPPAAQRPLCQYIRPYLLRYYCNLAKFNLATNCSAVSPPLPEVCPETPTEGITFEGITDSATPVPIPDDQYGLDWIDIMAVNSLAAIEADNEYNATVSGMISQTTVGLITDSVATFMPADTDDTITLRGLYMTAFTPSEQEIMLGCLDPEGGNPLGLASVTLTMNPIYVDVTETGTKVDYTVSGIFTGCSEIGILVEEADDQIVIDNIDLTIDQAGRVSPPADAIGSQRPAKLDLSTVPKDVLEKLRKLGAKRRAAKA